MSDFRIMIPFILQAEGGLSRAKTDSASKNSSPCVHNGQTGWHTNKGITWSTYQSYKARLGQKTDCSEFINMPNSLWNDIYKTLYWDAWKLSETKYQALANVIVSWAWGSGNTGAWNLLRKFANEKLNLAILDTKNQTERANLVVNLINSLEPKQVKPMFDALVEYRQKFFEGLNQPANLKGWTNRLKKFVEYNQQFLPQTDNNEQSQIFF